MVRSSASLRAIAACSAPTSSLRAEMTAVAAAHICYELLALMALGNKQASR